MWDNDGDFLLIEAAYALPKWLKPETASNRVWLLNGMTHIVPLPTRAAPDIPSFPSPQQARHIVQGDQVSTLAGALPAPAQLAADCCCQHGRLNAMVGTAPGCSNLSGGTSSLDLQIPGQQQSHKKTWIGSNAQSGASTTLIGPRHGRTCPLARVHQVGALEVAHAGAEPWKTRCSMDGATAVQGPRSSRL